MPVSDYSQLMAEMIAKARPQAISTGGGGRRVAAGTPLKRSSTATNVQVNIPSPQQIENWKNLLTGTPPRDVLLTEAKAAHGTWAKKYHDNPERAMSYLSNPSFQKNLERWYKAGYGGVIQREDGLWEFTPAPPPSMEELKALMAADLRNRVELSKPEERLIGAAPTTAFGMAGAEEKWRRPFIETQRELIGAEAGAQIETEAEALTRGGEETERYLRGKKELIGAAAAKQIETTNRQLQLEARGIFGKQLLKWQENYALVSGADEQTKFTELNKLGALVSGHVYDMKQFEAPADVSMRSMVYWSGLVNEEFKYDKKQKNMLDKIDESIAAGKAPEKGLNRSERARLNRHRHYINSLAGMIIDADLPPGMFHRRIVEWSSVAGLTTGETINTLMRTGLSEEESWTMIRGR